MSSDDKTDSLGVRAGTILVVDDEPTVLRVTARIIQMLGFATVEAPSGEEAVGIAAMLGESLSMLVTDVVMGGMNGIELAERIRTFRPKIPVLFISGHDFDALVSRNGLSSSADFLQKPFRPERLREKLSEMLNGPSQVAGQLPV